MKISQIQIANMTIIIQSVVILKLIQLDSILGVILFVLQFIIIGACLTVLMLDEKIKRYETKISELHRRD